MIDNLKGDHDKRQLPEERTFIHLVNEVTALFTPMDSAVHISVPEDGRLVVVGDLHGQLDDLLWILSEGQPSEKTHYLFNGDFVDRGPEQCEVLILLYAYKLLYPNSVWLNRGNHEEHRVNKAAGRDGFLQACVSVYSDAAYKAVQTSFQSLPLCHIINNTIAVVHGGLPIDVGVTISELRKINRFRECPCSKNRGAELPVTREDRIFQALMWSDPKEMKARTVMSSRGAGVWFNEDVTSDFLKTNGLQLLIRSHEVVSSGHRPTHHGKCVTVFSASRYCGKDDNLGSYIVILPKLEMNFSEFYIRRGQINALKDIAHRSCNALGNVSTDSMESSLLRNRPPAMDDADDIAKIKQLAIQRLGEMIFVKRSQLLAMFQNIDESKTATVSKRDFIRAMQAVLGEQLPWFSLSRHLVVPEENGMIFYIHFLERFQNKLATNYMKSWAAKWMGYGRSRIATCAVSLQKLLHDSCSSHHRKQEKLSYHEVTQALRDSIPGLSMTEIYYILLHMDKNNDGFLDADEWAEEMKQDHSGHTCLLPGILDIWDLQRTNIKQYDSLFKDLDHASWKGLVAKDTFLASAMRLFGKKPDAQQTWSVTTESLVKLSMNNPENKGNLIELSVVRTTVDSLEKERHKAKVVMDIIECVTRAQVRLHDMFRLLDKDKSGGLSCQEFVRGLTDCGIVESADEHRKRMKDRAAGRAVYSEVISADDAERLWQESDLDSDNIVTWKEFFEALSTYDTWQLSKTSSMRPAAVRWKSSIE
eukprot:TRINITY_DN6393_c1_g1_i2.p1 TRINITY_DN6393_c1_g1~~TRINITY_DN6393_c1_g1_i2.p1  ORF type:complete len:882 (+),score=323.81 TRINITY_DN6393_c1_g1_i2:372-2648(+)